MFKNVHKNKEGFTIIEVLIVLAIAGLIMLIVFLAVPALQRNQRNNARNNDASRVAAAVTECLANRNGSVDPTNGCSNHDNIKPGTLTRLEDYSVETTPDTENQIHATIVFQTRCTAEGDAVDTGATNVSQREFTVTYQLEPDVDRCIDS